MVYWQKSRREKKERGKCKHNWMKWSADVNEQQNLMVHHL